MNKVLIVRLGALGDLVHTLPAAAAIRREFPRARIDWLVDERHRELLDLVPIIDRRLAIRTSSAASLVDAIRELRRTHYDVALDFQGLLKSAVLARSSGATRVIGFPVPLLRERTASVFYTETAGVDAAHIIKKNVSLLRAVGIQHSAIEFPIEIRKPEIADAARNRLGIGERDPFAIINPGAAWPNKRWAPVYFAEVAVLLKKRRGLSSIVLWGPGEERLAQDVVDASQGAAAVSPPTTLAELVSLAKAAVVMVSGDTGPMHVAGAVGTPLIGIYGPTSPERNGPWASRDLIVSRFDQCQCHYQRQCHAKCWCLLEISPREVMDLVDERLEGLPTHA
ncbi:MAG TPA: glycosyltransferase family 9 protein [Vicinamibacterales bacterium]|nr:glycosyltransferase family 9 protein [Vicinamibacterales bacterium]